MVQFQQFRRQDATIQQQPPPSGNVVKCKRNTGEEELRRAVRDTPRGAPLEVNLKELAESQCDELVPILGDAVLQHPSLEILSVTAAELGEEAGQVLVEAVAASTTLKLFVIRAEYLAVDTVLSLAELVANGSRLEGLTISGMFSEDDVGEAFGEALSANCTLKAFVLEGDCVGDSIGVAVAKALETNTTLRELSIHGDLLGDSTGLAMADALRTNATLESLRLEGASVSDVGGRALADALRCNGRLLLLELTGHALGDDTGQAFAKTLGENRTLRSLAIRALRGATLASSGCPALAAAAVGHEVLQVLEIVCSGKTDVVAVANMVRQNRSLRCLTVRGHVRDEGCAMLAAALRENWSLAAFHVHCTELTKASAKALQVALRYNASLMWSNISIKGWPTAAAAAALERNRDLPRCWRDLALVARKSEVLAIGAAVAAMTERGFRCSVYAFLLPPRWNTHRETD